MKTTIKLSILALMVAFFTTSCTKNRIKGTGPSVSESYTAANFSKVDLSLDAELNYIYDTDYSVEITAQENVQDRMRVEKIGDVLILSFKNNTNLLSHDGIIINVHSPEFTGADLSGSGCINVKGAYTSSNVTTDISGSGKIDIENLEMNNLNVDISGSGKLTIAHGSADRISTDISGSGKIYLHNVRAQDVKTRTAGSGRTEVWAEKTLDVDIAGSGNVYYAGSPTINVDIAGSGKLRKL